MCILSQNGLRNLPDHYNVTVYDITEEIITSLRIEVPHGDHSDHCFEFGDIFSQYSANCAPFLIYVSAMNNFGSMETTLSVNFGNESGDVCSCLFNRGEIMISLIKFYYY